MHSIIFKRFGFSKDSPQQERFTTAFWLKSAILETNFENSSKFSKDFSECFTFSAAKLFVYGE